MISTFGCSTFDKIEFKKFSFQFQDQSQPNKQSAVRIKILPFGTVQFETVVQRNVNGTVTREPSNSWVQRSPSRVNISNYHRLLKMRAHRNYRFLSLSMPYCYYSYYLIALDD